MKKRILFVTPLPPPVHGSAMVSQYIRDSKVIKGEFQCDFVNLSTSRKMDEIGKNSPVKIFRFIGSYFCLLWKLMFNRYDLCYFAIAVHGKGFLKDAPFVLLCKLFGRKVLIHQHNKGMSHFVGKPIYRWLYKKVYSEAKVMLLSWHLYDDISSVVKREDVMVCPNGTPSVLTGEPMFKRENDVSHFLFLSNLIIDKGILVLLDAVKILKERGFRLSCDAIGGDTKEISAARFANEIKNRNIADVVTYYGKQYGEDKNRFWRQADVFVFPTFYYNECFPLVLLEAMEQGVPCISTNEGGIADIIEDGNTGIIVPKQNAVALADAMESLLKAPSLRERMGRAGYEKYQRQFTLDVFERNFTQIIKDITG